jgi:hypothetical protein
MTPRFRPRRASCLRVALFIVAAAAFFVGSADEARATCGDYLSHHLAGDADGSGDLNSADRPFEQPAPTGPTCRDGSCRGGVPPAPPNPPRTRTVVDHWGCALTFKPADRDVGEATLDGSDESAPAFFPAELFRPPEFA